jgi:hypothetical protein
MNMSTRSISALALVLFAFGCLSAVTISAQPPPVAENNEPLQIIVDYGPEHPPKHRVSRHGIVEPVGVPMGQQVAITLKFLRRRAGERIAVTALDPGTIALQQPATIPEDGAVMFLFTGITPGLCRVQVYGGPAYELRLYVFDPSAQPPQHP